MNQASPQTREFARRLLACESALEDSSGMHAQVAFRICEKLRHQLCTLAGVEGFRSILARALTLAKAEVPALAAVQVNADGSLGVSDSTEWQQNLEDSASAEILVAQLLGLLITFIGLPLTGHIVNDIWRETLCGYKVSETENLP